MKDLWELADRIEESIGHEDANLLRSFLKRIEDNGKEAGTNICAYAKKDRVDER